MASPRTEKSGSGQTVLRVVRRIVSDPDSPGVKPNRLLKRDDEDDEVDDEDGNDERSSLGSLLGITPMVEMRSVCHP